MRTEFASQSGGRANSPCGIVRCLSTCFHPAGLPDVTSSSHAGTGPAGPALRIVWWVTMCQNMAMRYLRTLEIVLGLVFVFSALTKAMDMYATSVSVSYYGIVRDPELVRTVAYVMVSLEALLGAAPLAGVRLGGLTVAATGAMLLGFSGLIAYAWQFQGLKDCGCFGKYIQMTPGESLLKNAILLVLVIGAWIGYRRVSRKEMQHEGTRPRATGFGYAMGSLALVVVLMAAASGAPSSPQGPKTPDVPKDRPFAKFVVTDGNETLNLATGDYLVAMLSATCEHCQAATGILNGLTAAPGVPQIVGLMMGDKDEMQMFRDLTAPAFPVMSIDTLAFFQLIGKEPPRFYVIHDGAVVRRLDEMDPTADDLLAFATGADSKPSPPQ